MRWRLAGWYTGVMSLILALFGLAVYQLLTEAHWHALHRELASVAGTLHDGLEPTLKQPGEIDESAAQLLPGLCLISTTCSEQVPTKERHILGAVQQKGYYVRFLTQSGQPIATVGQQPKEFPIALQQALWQTIENREGKRYHQIASDIACKIDCNQQHNKADRKPDILFHPSVRSPPRFDRCRNFL